MKLQKKIWNKILGERIWKTKFKNKFGRKKTLGTKIQKKKIEKQKYKIDLVDKILNITFAEKLRSKNFGSKI